MSIIIHFNYKGGLMKFSMKIIGFSLFMLMLFNFSLYNTSAVTWDTVVTFTGVGGKTTQSFTISKDSRFVWSTTYDNSEFAMLAAFVYEIGEDSKFETDFDGLSGTSYFYKTGDFYLKVIVANLNSWEVEVQQELTTTNGNGDNADSTSFPYLLMLLAIPIIIVMRKKLK